MHMVKNPYKLISKGLTPSGKMGKYINNVTVSGNPKDNRVMKIYTT